MEDAVYDSLHGINKVLQTSTLDLALRDTQTRFYALDMNRGEKPFSIDDGFNLLKLSVRDAEKDNSLRLMVSTYDPVDQMIRDGYYDGGAKSLRLPISCNIKPFR